MFDISKWDEMIKLVIKHKSPATEETNNAG